MEWLIRQYHFWKHDYRVNDFSPKYVQHNLSLLFRGKGEVSLNAHSDGKLIEISGPFGKALFWIKNALTFGAFQSRIVKCVHYTMLSLLLEVTNPFNAALIETFIERKKALLERLLEKVKVINGKEWSQQDLVEHLKFYIRNSRLQQKVIENIHKAVKRAKKTKEIKQIEKGLEKGVHPRLVTQGLSGSYWMRDANREVVGIFKPFDEEIYAPNNPIGPALQGALGQRKIRNGVRVGESAHREVAAYLVDAFFGFGIVPKTRYAQFSHVVFFSSFENRNVRRQVKTKIGSLQEVVEGFRPLHELTINEGKKIDLEEFQLLVVLDVILGNSDRNTGNILVADEKIAAIDHGLCFSDFHEELSVWYWTILDQGKELLYPAIAQMVQEFPFEAVSHLLSKKCFIEDRALHRMRERIALFAAAVAAGLAPDKIAPLMTDENLNVLRNLDLKLKDAANGIISRQYHVPQ